MNNLKIFVGTFNVAEQDIPMEELRKWLLPDDPKTRYDLYSIGVQECPKMCCLLPTRATTYKEKWESSLCQVLGKEFEIIHTASFGVQMLAILIRTNLKHFVQGKPVDFTVCVRFLSRKKRTKGAIIVCLNYNGLKIAFVSCHLRFGTSRKSRQDDFRIIYDKFSSHNPWKSDSTSNRYIFWSGDINSRFDNLAFDEIHDILKSEHINFLQFLQYDQLYDELKTGGPMFKGFSESRIRFLPTYKFYMNSNQRDSTRNPGYADRILYHVHPENRRSLNVIRYDSVSVVCSSDHKPVYCIFEIISKRETNISDHSDSNSTQTSSTYST